MAATSMCVSVLSVAEMLCGRAKQTVSGLSASPSPKSIWMVRNENW